MSKYYKVEDIDNAIREAHAEAESNEIGEAMFHLHSAVSDLPTIDIVHCKDCKNVTYKINTVRTQDVFYGCHYSKIQHDGDFYCAYGERKDNE